MSPKGRVSGIMGVDSGDSYAEPPAIHPTSNRPAAAMDAIFKIRPLLFRVLVSVFVNSFAAASILLNQNHTYIAPH
jgi:hypothetical protein